MKNKHVLVERATGRVVQEGEEIVDRKGNTTFFIKVEAGPVWGGDIWVKPKTIKSWDYDGEWHMGRFPNYQIVEVPDE